MEVDVCAICRARWTTLSRTRFFILSFFSFLFYFLLLFFLFIYLFIYLFYFISFYYYYYFLFLFLFFLRFRRREGADFGPGCMFCLVAVIPLLLHPAYIPSCLVPRHLPSDTCIPARRRHSASTAVSPERRLRMLGFSGRPSLVVQRIHSAVISSKYASQLRRGAHVDR
ncbi:hypothetical protein VUR80DRAFT_3442 [Thermomyces stellatus]